jgi:hypothetical protein
VADGVYVRDPFDPTKEGYFLGQQGADEIYEWVTRGRWENQGRPSPDQWTVVKERREGTHAWDIYQHRFTDACVEVAYTLIEGSEFDHEAHSLPAEQAYAIALDVDDDRRARGQVIYNERHPGPPAS